MTSPSTRGALIRLTGAVAITEAGSRMVLDKSATEWNSQDAMFGLTFGLAVFYFGFELLPFSL